MRADAAAGSRPRIASAIPRCSRTEASSTGAVSTSPTCAMMSGNCSRAASSRSSKIVGERHHRVVEGGVLLEIIARLAGAIGMDRLDRGGKARAPVGRVGRGGEPGGERLHFDPDQEQFADLALREPPHDRAAMRPMLDQPVGAEPPQRLPAPARG